MLHDSSLRARRGSFSAVDVLDVVAGEKTILQSSDTDGRQFGPKAPHRIPRHKLLEWHELPSWQRDNEYILSGYRFPSGSFWRSFKSVCHIHNETVNIYSYLIGGILFATLPFVIYHGDQKRSALAQLSDLAVFSTFFFGVATCFFLSATFHILANHSQAVAAYGNQLDYLGVIILMWGSTIPTVYYGFHGDLKLQTQYWTLITVLAITCTITALNPRFRHPTLRPYRAAMYLGLGFSAIIFVAHGILKYGVNLQRRRMSLDWMIVMTTFNVVGALTYAVRVPECWHPYTYDILGASHQVLHFMVIFAGLAHVVGLLKAFDYVRRQENSFILV